jgi:hypothetical protein
MEPRIPSMTISSRSNKTNILLNSMCGVFQIAIYIVSTRHGAKDTRFSGYASRIVQHNRKAQKDK